MQSVPFGRLLLGLTQHNRYNLDQQFFQVRYKPRSHILCGETEDLGKLNNSFFDIARTHRSARRFHEWAIRLRQQSVMGQ